MIYTYTNENNKQTNEKMPKFRPIVVNMQKWRRYCRDGMLEYSFSKAEKRRLLHKSLIQYLKMADL